MFKGKVFASQNRYGQETVGQVRPMQRGENQRLNSAANAVLVIATDGKPVLRVPKTVHPSLLK
jgi:hypothetical protein